jgi:hypothetical protein
LCAMVHGTSHFLHKIEAIVLDELTRCFTSILNDCVALAAMALIVQDLGASHGGSKVAPASFIGQMEAVQCSKAHHVPMRW